MSAIWLQFDPANRREAFWRLQIMGWGGLVAGTAIMAMAGGYAGWETFVLELFRAIFGFALTSFLLRPGLRIARRRRMALLPAVFLAIVGSGLFAWVDLLGASALARAIDVTNDRALGFLRASLVLRWILYFLWCGLYYMIHNWMDLQESQSRLARLEAAMRTAELQRLRAQVNPHFLFNALNAIMAETENPRAVAALTQGVAEYLRFSLRQPEAGQSLGEELDALGHYLQVEKFRFEDRLEFSIAAAENVRCRRVPGALVQPLVENAIKYGQRTSPRPLRIAIETRIEDAALVISVANTGTWLEPDPARGGGIGLSNLRRRLELIFGAGSRVEVTHEAGWVRVRLRLPVEAGA